MPLIPRSLLSKLYVKGSLRNTEEGFEFSLHNVLAPGTIIGLGPLYVDDQEYEAGQLVLVGKASVRPASLITPETAFSFPVNATATVRVKGKSLAPGPHRILLVVHTREVGRLEIPLSDTVQEPPDKRDDQAA